jgi:hypothetical protein
MKRIGFAIVPLALLLSAAAAQKSARPAAQPITVYRTATCGCCGKWVDHLKAAGFAPTVQIVESTNTVEARKRVPEQIRTCHTATLEGYVVEGHVPPDVIHKLLREKPRVEGIGVPGMPAGSPGMESPNPQPYDVLAFDGKGTTSVFAKVPARK